MKLLNLGAGNCRPQSEIWTNLDRLHPVLLPGTPERIQLDSEKNYVEWDLGGMPRLPFAANWFDGILAAHVFEHFDCMEAVEIMAACHRALKPNGILVVSVPDASYFRKVYAEDNAENCERLFGEPLREGASFFNTALFYREHKAILTEDALWCYYLRAGFHNAWRVNPGWAVEHPFLQPTIDEEIYKLINRLTFSLVMMGNK